MHNGLDYSGSKVAGRQEGSKIWQLILLFMIKRCFPEGHDTDTSYQNASTKSTNRWLHFLQLEVTRVIWVLRQRDRCQIELVSMPFRGIHSIFIAITANKACLALQILKIVFGNRKIHWIRSSLRNEKWQNWLFC